MEEKFPKRKTMRWDKRDYSAEGAYFITICTKDRKSILSRITSVGGDVLDAPKKIELLPFGELADYHLKKISGFYKNIEIDQYVIMPNHIHIILILLENGPSGTSAPTKQHSGVSRFVSTFKRFCNKEIGTNIWQRSFFDRVIRDREEYVKICNYILENPFKWEEDELFFEE